MQTLKATGIIRYTKISGAHFYDAEDIQQSLQRGKMDDRLK